MAEIINLRRARKGEARAAKAASAVQARTKHGVAKAERALGKARSVKAKRDVDAHRLDSEN